MPTRPIDHGWRTIASTAKRLAVITAGFILCGAGLTMLVLPGPGVVVTFVGLTVLSTEYTWAERVLERARAPALTAARHIDTSRTARAAVAMSAAGLITGGATAVAILDNHRYLGVAVVIAGFGALAILLPVTRRLIDRAPPARSRARRSEPTRHCSHPIEPSPPTTEKSPT